MATGVIELPLATEGYGFYGSLRDVKKWVEPKTLHDSLHSNIMGLTVSQELSSVAAGQLGGMILAANYLP
jgi:hypothetical protein